MKTYSLSDIIPEQAQSTGYYAGIFEETEDPDIEANHRHDYYSIVWLTQGEGINVIDFEEYDMKHNRIFTMSPRQIHNWSYSAGSKGYFIIIEQPLAEHLKLEFNAAFSDIKLSESKFIEEIFRRLIVSERNFQHDTIAISYLYSLLDHGSVSNVDGNSKFFEFKELIGRNHSINASIEQYASELHISAETLTKICLKKTGITPKQMQLDFKITEAKRLLLYTSLNSSEIAYRCGFEDGSYFSRIFKKKTGFSPGSFRKKYLKDS